MISRTLEITQDVADAIFGTATTLPMSGSVVFFPEERLENLRSDVLSVNVVPGPVSVERTYRDAFTTRHRVFVICRVGAESDTAIDGAIEATEQIVDAIKTLSTSNGDVVEINDAAEDDVYNADMFEQAGVFVRVISVILEATCQSL